MTRAGDRSGSPRKSSHLAAVKNSKNNKSLAVYPILDDIGSIHYLHHNLSIFLVAGEMSSQTRIFQESLHRSDDFVGNNACKQWIPLLEKSSEPVEIRERVLRPLDPHRSAHGRNAGVPQVLRQLSTSA